MRAIAPMLATLGQLPSGAADGGYGYEVKWDGVRAIGYLGADGFQLLSRNERDITAAYPELTPVASHGRGTVRHGALSGHRDLVVDGESVAFDAAGRPSPWPAAHHPRTATRPGVELTSATGVGAAPVERLRAAGLELSVRRL